MTMQYPIAIEVMGTPGAGKTTLIRGLEHQLQSSLSGITTPDAKDLLPKDFSKKRSNEANDWIRLKTAEMLLEFEEVRRSGNYDIIFMDNGYVNSIFMDYIYCKSTSILSANGVIGNYKRLTPPDIVVMLTVTPLQAWHRGKVNFTREELCIYNEALKTFYSQIMPCRMKYQLDTSHLNKRQMVSKVYEVISRELP